MRFVGGVTLSKLAAEELWWGLSRSPENAKADDAIGSPLLFTISHTLHLRATLVEEIMEKFGRQLCKVPEISGQKILTVV